MTAARQSSLPLQLPEGVHLRLPARLYEDSQAIGAEDLRLLYWDPTSWWAQSSHNPHRQQPRRIARRHNRDMGEALRILVTQGDEAYAAAYAVEPDDGRSDWVRTRDGMRDLLREKHVEIPRGVHDDASLWRLVRKHGLAHRVFEVARADYESARRSGRRHMTEANDRALRYAARLIRAHKDLGPALAGGLCDVTVFWRREDDPDTLLRARFDYLRRRRIYEIEKVGGAGARDIGQAISRAIEEGDLDIARRLNAEAWERMAGFVSAGVIHAWGADGERSSVLSDERELLKSYVAAGAPDWFWIFAQLPVDDIGSERGLVIAPRGHRPQGRLWEAGGHKIAAGLAAFRNFRDRFSVDRPWAQIDEARELVDDDVRIRLKKETA